MPRQDGLPEQQDGPWSAERRRRHERQQCRTCCRGMMEGTVSQTATEVLVRAPETGRLENARLCVEGHVHTTCTWCAFASVLLSTGVCRKETVESALWSTTALVQRTPLLFIRTPLR